MNEGIELYTAEGEPVVYRPPAARLMEFLARFGPERGFAVRTEISDLLGLRPGLLRLYETAAREGRTAEAPGLPPLSRAAGALVCRAVLEGPDGRILATATAAEDVREHEDLETLETAARRRLLAALGFGGEVLAADERLDFVGQGRTEASEDGAPADVVPLAPADVVPLALADVVPLAPAGEGEPAPTDLTRPSATGATAAKPAGKTAPADRQLALLRRQIESRARLQGMAPPVVTTVDEARAALKALIENRHS